MIMRFNKDEILAVMRQHVLDQWDVTEGAIEGLSIRLLNPQPQPDGAIHYDVYIDVKVKTNPKDGGGPYRTAGR